MSNAKDIMASILEGADVREAIAGPTVTKKVVRNGKIVKKKFLKIHKKHVLTAAQRAAVKKAARAASKTSAKLKRTKSLKKAKAFEETDLKFGIICPACGAGNVVPVNAEDAPVTLFGCPDCDAEFVLANLAAFNPAELDDADTEDDDEDVEVDAADDGEAEDGEAEDEIDAESDDEDPVDGAEGDAIPPGKSAK